MIEVAKGRTEFFDKLKMTLDIGSHTADAVQQPDGSWEVHGQGSAALIATMAAAAERKARKVNFLPRQVERKAARSVQLTLESAGQATLCDGTVVRRLETNG